MLSLPQLTANSNARTADAKASGTNVGTEAGSGGFGQLLDQITDRPVPKDLRDDLMAQVANGVPLDVVLGNLVDRLQDQDIGLVPGMLPVLQALLPSDAKEGLAALSGGKGGVSRDLGDALAKAEGEVANDADGLKLAQTDDGNGAEALLAKHKVALAGRVTAVDALTNAGALVNTTQATPLRGLELPSAMTSLPAAATDGPDGLLIPQRIGDPQWGQALAQRVVWMVGQDKQVAEIRLNPANLGPLEVKLTLHHDQASVHMLASTGAVRDALEQALPRLRDLLGQQDIQLAHVDVGHRQPSGEGHAEGQAAGQGGTGPGGNDQRGADDVDPDSGTMTAIRAGRGLVDAYA